MAEVFDINEVKNLKRNQEMNKIVSRYKSVFVTLLNKFLDQLYNATDADEIAEEDKKVFTPEQYQQIKDQEESIELTRKKIQNNAPLEESEIVEILLIAQHIETSLTVDAKNLVKASEQIGQIVKEFLKF